MSKAIAALALVALLATTAHAQPEKRLSLGVGVGVNGYADKSFSSPSPSIEPEYHLRLTTHGDREGFSFGWRGSIGYSNPDRSDFIGGEEMRTGTLRMIPVMAGFGPFYRTGPLSIGMGVVAGPSFNTFSVDDASRAAYRDRLGATLNSIDVQTSVAVRPDASLWYNLTPWLGPHTGVSYTINRPLVKTTVDGVTTTTRWKTDKLGYQAGFVVGVF
jgi:hypothetical protein